MPGETTVNNKNVTLTYGRKDTIAEINGTPITVTMPAEPSPGAPASFRHITNITQNGDVVTFTWSEGEPATTTITVGGGGGGSLWEHVGDYIIPIDRTRKVYGYGFYDTDANA